MEREPVQDQAASEKDQFVIAANELLEPNYFEVVIDQGDVAGDGTMEGGQGAVDCADPLDDPNPDAAALQDFDPFIDSPPSECRNSPVLAPAKIDDSRKWASLEIKIADNEIQRIVIQKKIADLEQRIEVLKKENEASKKIVASASSANSTTPSASQVVSVHSLESAIAKQVALVEDPYMLNMLRIEQRVTNEGWENVLLVNPNVRVNV
ncbi:uncharacterized protein LOC135936519 isoform X2 [Cloeon dipterum]|uniref:uncharacterized protein LOC135936519 isoform X2 n=1 Tax=Cloeon dipterum TaxID=197152 RepID=UPI00321FAD2A